MSLEITKLTKDDALKVLGVESTASQEEIKNAYKTLAFTCHPDKTGSTLLFQLINNAYQRLKEKPTSSPAKTASENASENTKQPAKTVQEILQDKEFLVEFWQFASALEFLDTPIHFKGYRFMLTKNIINRLFVRTTWSGMLYVRQYKNLFDYIMHKPISSKKQYISFRNGPQSTWFEKTIRVTGNNSNKRTKFYRVELAMSVLNTTLQHNGYLSKANKQISMKYTTTTPEGLNLVLNLRFD